MSYVEWGKFFSVKVEYIDNQHRNLINIVNQFYDQFSSSVNFKEHIFATLNSLIGYCEEHFLHEEKLMESTGVPKDLIDAHKEIHQKLTEDIFLLNEHLQRGDKKTISELEMFLDKWLIKHILDEDKKLIKYFSQMPNYKPRPN